VFRSYFKTKLKKIKAFNHIYTKIKYLISKNKNAFRDGSDSVGNPLLHVPDLLTNLPCSNTEITLLYFDFNPLRET
jgi:hypothetical protein